MFSDGDNPKPYSQLAAVQVGSFMKDGAMSFGRIGDREVFHIDFDRLPASIEKLMQKVGQVKASGDAAGAKALVEDFVTGEDSRLVHMDVVQGRLRRFPKPSFTYTVLH
jgi:hypothetical protein